VPARAAPPAQIAAADAGDPIEPDPVRSFQDDLRFAALSEQVQVGRTVIIRENHEPEAIRPVHGDHQNNPSLLGFQG
jgi:hypothetical protein